MLPPSTMPVAYAAAELAKRTAAQQPTSGGTTNQLWHLRDAVRTRRATSDRFSKDSGSEQVSSDRDNVWQTIISDVRLHLAQLLLTSRWSGLEAVLNAGAVLPIFFWAIDTGRSVRDHQSAAT